MSQFQLFPPPPPQMKGSKNPFRKGAKSPRTKSEPAASIPLEDPEGTSKTESVLVQIFEDTAAIPPPPAVHATRLKSPAATEVSPDSNSSPSPSSRDRQINTPDKWTVASPGHRSNSSSSRSKTTGSTASPLSSQSSPSSVPMRSMFPQFDPQLGLNQQHYYPQRPSQNQPVDPSHKPDKLSISTSSGIDQALGPKTVPASLLDFPAGVLETEEFRYSSLQELGLLWEAANGQRAQSLDGTFNLRMSKTGPATFTFGNEQQPFYRLHTYSTDELSISRRDPSKSSSDVPIMMLTLEDRRRREIPNDGLVALLFSRLAAMLAIEQAAEIGTKNHLTPNEESQVESDALKRAAAQESCRLSWNSDRRLYELRHPSLSKRHPPPLVGAAGIPLSPVRSQSSGILHITVSAPTSDISPSQLPNILVTGPVSSTAMEAALQAANPRTSTLPVPDSDEPLAALDFATKTLSISPAAVIATIPSLYAIDSLIAAILAVAVSDEATNPILADMSLGSPSYPEQRTRKGPSAHAIPFRGQLVTTLAEREDAGESLDLASQIESAKTKRQTLKRKCLLRFWDQSRSTSIDGSRTSGKNQQIVVEEFDLERYGRYGAGSPREGEKLPSVTRGLLRILFWGLDLLVRVLTLVVRILAWFLVHSTRCVTSEKF